MTRGPMLISGTLLSYLAPSSGILTVVSNGTKTDPSIIGQIMYTAGSQYAHLTFLTPVDGLESTALPALLDYLASIAGELGSFRLLADVDEHSTAFEALRQSGFAVYTRQRIWQETRQPSKEGHLDGWRTATNQDLIAIRTLYNNLVPGLVQQVEPYTAQTPHGLVCYQGEELLAYMELKYGRRGIWVQPFVHPDMEVVVGCFLNLTQNRFLNLTQNLPNRRSRPIYICIRSYQAWLEQFFEDLGAEAGPRQAVMVKHMSVTQKSARAYVLPALESGQPEVSAPIVRSESKH
ncbi:MAG: hypothetical protein P8Z00_07850 [Anaerolineales bacterium]